MGRGRQLFGDLALLGMGVDFFRDLTRYRFPPTRVRQADKAIGLDGFDSASYLYRGVEGLSMFWEHFGEDSNIGRNSTLCVDMRHV